MGILEDIVESINPVEQIVGTIDSVSSLFGGSSDQRFAKSMMDKQNAFNAQQAQLNRDFQSQQWDNHFQAINEYNDPSAQFQRLRSAGVNPWNSEGQGYSSTASNVSAPSGSSASAGSGIASQPFSSRWSDLEGASKAIAEADKVGIDTDYLKRTLEDRIVDTAARSKIQDVLSKYQEKMSQKELSLITQKIQETIERWQNISSETEANDTWKRWLALSQKDFYLKQTDLQDVMKSIYDNYHRNWQDKLYESEIGKNNSIIGVNQSQEKLNQTRDALAKLEEYIRNSTNESEKIARLKEFEETATRQGLITESLRQTLRTLEKNNDWYGFNMILKTLGVGADVYGVVKGPKQLNHERTTEGYRNGKHYSETIFDSYFE